MSEKNSKTEDALGIWSSGRNLRRQAEEEGEENSLGTVV